MTKATANTLDGTVVSMTGDKLTSTCTKGNEHVHTLAKDAAITRDGQPGRTKDLKPGTPIRLTMQKDDKSVVTAVETGRNVQAAVVKA